MSRQPHRLGSHRREDAKLTAARKTPLWHDSLNPRVIPSYLPVPAVNVASPDTCVAPFGYQSITASPAIWSPSISVKVQRPLVLRLSLRRSAMAMQCAV